MSDPRRKPCDLEYYLTLADALVAHGCDALAIKDMAGLLKPQAATLLVGALRKRFPNTVIHVHTVRGVEGPPESGMQGHVCLSHSGLPIWLIKGSASCHRACCAA